MKNVKIRNGRGLTLRKILSSDFERLTEYLASLSIETRNRFGPHLFDYNSIVEFHTAHRNLGFVAIEASSGMIVAYSVIKIGFLDHDQPRLESYGIKLSDDSDACFAPSVSDQWQSLGIGNLMLQYILDELKPMGVRRIILWGGVQMGNEKAINYYKKNGFIIMGHFEYNGLNQDMMLEV